MGCSTSKDSAPPPSRKHNQRGEKPSRRARRRARAAEGLKKKEREFVPFDLKLSSDVSLDEGESALAPHPSSPLPPKKDDAPNQPIELAQDEAKSQPGWQTLPHLPPVITKSTKVGISVSSSEVKLGVTFSLSSGDSNIDGSKASPPRETLRFHQLSLCAPVVDSLPIQHHAGGCFYRGVYIPILAQRQDRLHFELKVLIAMYAGTRRKTTVNVALSHSSLHGALPSEDLVSGDGLLWWHPSLKDGMRLPLTAFRGASDDQKQTPKFRELAEETRVAVNTAFTLIEKADLATASVVLQKLLTAAIDRKSKPKLIVLLSCVLGLTHDLHQLATYPKEVIAALKQQDLEGLLAAALTRINEPRLRQVDAWFSDISLPSSASPHTSGSISEGIAKPQLRDAPPSAHSSLETKGQPWPQNPLQTSLGSSSSGSHPTPTPLQNAAQADQQQPSVSLSALANELQYLLGMRLQYAVLVLRLECALPLA